MLTEKGKYLSVTPRKKPVNTNITVVLASISSLLSGCAFDGGFTKKLLTSQVAQESQNTSTQENKTGEGVQLQMDRKLNGFNHGTLIAQASTKTIEQEKNPRITFFGGDVKIPSEATEIGSITIYIREILIKFPGDPTLMPRGKDVLKNVNRLGINISGPDSNKIVSHYCEGPPIGEQACTIEGVGRYEVAINLKK